MRKADERSLRTRRPRTWADRHLVLLTVVALAVMLFLTPAVFTPWIYYAGGHFHGMPMWAGAGTFQGAKGQEWLYIRLYPTPSRGAYLSTALTGDGYLCTDRAERIHLTLSGGMPRHLPNDVTGQPITFRLYQRAIWGSNYRAGSPRLDLKGVWGAGQIDASGHIGRVENSSGVSGRVTPVAVVFKEAPVFLAPACLK